MRTKGIFLIDGAAGAGKSDLLEFVADRLAGKDVKVLSKYSTRELRDVEKRSNKALDLKFVDPARFEELAAEPDFVRYQYPRKDGAFYGIRLSEIREAIEHHDAVFLIVRSAATIRDIIKALPDHDVFPIFVYTVETEIRARLCKEGYGPEEIDFRLSRTSYANVTANSGTPVWKATRSRLILAAERATASARRCLHDR